MSLIGQMDGWMDEKDRLYLLIFKKKMKEIKKKKKIVKYKMPENSKNTLLA